MGEERSFWPFEMTRGPLACMKCGHGDEADVTLNWVSVCDPGGESVTGWLHRNCEEEFLSGWPKVKQAPQRI